MSKVVNKYGTNYDELVNMTDTQMYEYLNKICEKYKCIEIVEWSPKDGQGNILHNQVEAHIIGNWWKCYKLNGVQI